MRTLSGFWILAMAVSAIGSAQPIKATSPLVCQALKNKAEKTQSVADLAAWHKQCVVRPRAIKMIDRRHADEKPRRPKATVVTVAAFDHQFDGAAVDIFGNEDVSRLSVADLIPKFAMFIKDKNFRRNPTFITDGNGFFVPQIDVYEVVENKTLKPVYYHFSVSYRGVIWPFNSKKNAEAFSRNPDKYVPAFGGYCAYCIVEDDTITYGKSFAVYADRLYMFAGDYWRDRWLKKPEYYIVEGNRIWRSTSIRKLGSPTNIPMLTDAVSAALKR